MLDTRFPDRLSKRLPALFEAALLAFEQASDYFDIDGMRLVAKVCLMNTTSCYACVVTASRMAEGGMTFRWLSIICLPTARVLLQSD